jgi:hypothetical protein
MKQQKLADGSFEKFRKKTRKEQFVDLHPKLTH